MKYRKKPVVIEAMCWDGKSVKAMLDFGDSGPAPLWGDDFKIDKAGVHITTPEGVMRADVGDWVIRGIAGEFYPCKPEIFEATYEAVEP